MKVFLVGYMCSGKTTTGKMIAKALSLNFVDTDEYFESKYKISVNSFFSKYNENVFRKLETDILNELVLMDNLVVSTGGGMACFNENMHLINRNGISIYIQMSVKSLVHRIVHSKKDRPLLHNLSHGELENFVDSQLEHRQGFYNQAMIKVKGEDIDIRQIIEKINELSSFQ